MQWYCCSSPADPQQVASEEGNNEINEANSGGSTAHQNIAGSINLIGGAELPKYAATEMGSESEDVAMEMESDSDTPVDAEAGMRRDFFLSIQSDISQLKQVLRELVREEDDIKEQLKALEHMGKKHKTKVDDWLHRVQQLKCEACQMTYIANQSGYLETTKLNDRIRKHKKQKPLVLSNEVVGASFEKNVKDMWKLLKDDREFIIGICGMGGVGKTCLVTYMENEIKRKRTFNHVFVVTVSHTFSISKLQHDIAEQIGAELNEDDEGKRALSLSLALEAKGKSVLVLEDVWENIDLQKVGIPLKVNGIKLIVTSRLQHVCEKMRCSPKGIIKICPLYHDEGWELFLLKLGHNGTPATLPEEVVEVAKSVANECDGLPLGISVMATTMKGLNHIHWWRRALNKLQNLEIVEEMEDEVLKALRFSYYNLKEKSVQDCFLHCTLYHGMSINRSDLVMNLVYNGLINGTRTLQEIIDEGHIILDKLEGQSLLLSKSAGIQMHGLVRKMACLEIKEDHRFMVKCNKELRKVPDLQEWTSHLEVVSLMDNMIEEIPAGTSPPCPRLCTLILSNNHIKDIPNCFFTNLNSLAVLDLSCNFHLTCLPDSLSELRSLISLVLQSCNELNYLPPLGELKSLSRLNISGTKIKEVLGLEKLINLKWLDLSWRRCSNSIAGSMLSGLTNLQHLDLSGSDPVRVTEKDLEKMSKLERFSGSFEECQNYNNYVQKILDKGFGPKYYHIHARPDPFEFTCDHKRQIVSFGDCNELITTHFLPRDRKSLYIKENKHWQCLCNALSCNYPSPVQNIEVSRCTRLESLFCSLLHCSLCKNLRKLEVCLLEDLNRLTAICKEDTKLKAFYQIKELIIMGCHKLEKLFTPAQFRQLQHLEELHVEECDSLKEIFAQSNSSSGDNDLIDLPKLTKLTMRYLPQLKIVSKAIIFGSMPTFDIYACPKLELFSIIITEAGGSASFGSSDSD